LLTKVLIARRFCGGVAITEKSRRPSSERPSVRGIGVAVRVSTSTCARSAFSASFWRTPKRCSLVDDDEAEALEFHVLLQQAMGADQDVDPALSQQRKRLRPALWPT
jgi:hypothetical protein